MKFNSDIDIDFSDRDKILNLIDHTPAAMRNIKPMRKHSTGIYVTDIPYDPANNMASIDYTEAERRGYVKLDFLNVHVYSQVKSERHLFELMREPNWELLKYQSVVEKLIHLGNHYHAIKKMPEPINSIPRLAMFLAVIRPAKKHLVGKYWSEVSRTIWDKDQSGYAFKKAHAISYAWLVAVHLNLLEEQGIITI
jgi:hypothetical protein